MEKYLMVYGIGSISEIFDGNELIIFRGCIV